MIFPTTNIQPEITTSNDLPVYTDWAFDFENNCLALKGGRQYKVEKQEALKIWIWKALNTPRLTYPVYSKNFGQDFGKFSENNLPALNERLTRCIKETLLANVYITGVEGFDIQHDHDRVDISFVVNTIYGNVESEVSI